MITAEHVTRICGEKDCQASIADWNRIGYCRTCRNKHRKKPYNSDYEAGWRKRSQPAVTLRNAKQRAKAEGFLCTITARDISPIPESCTSCNISMDRYGIWRTQPSLDRVIPELGYIPGNVAWICRRCNQVKNNGTLEELRTVVAYIERHL